MLSHVHRIAALFALVLFAIGLVRILIDRNALRDKSTSATPPYSLARVQLWWWTALVLGSWIVLFGLLGELPMLTAECLALLGISSLTTAASRVVDNRKASKADPISTEKSDGFFTDILSDSQGLSVHRFQSVAFHVMYGLAFLIATIADRRYPHLGEAALSLLGVSSGTYVSVKAIGSKSEAGATPATAPAANADEEDEP